MAVPDRRMTLVIVGPTGVGKTAVACIVARELDGEIVSADSRQIYRGMDIGTAKPTPAQRAAVRHHMLDVADPDACFDAARFASMARDCIKEIAAAGKVPMLVGGTGLYVKAAIEGLTPAPPRDEDLRRRLRAEEIAEPGVLCRRLKRVDPGRAAVVGARDVARIIRALEVYELTGRRLSEVQAEWEPRPIRHVAVGLIRPRREMYERIDSRVLEMVRDGLFEEAEALLERGVPPDAPGLRTIGYREAVACLTGGFDKAQAVALIQRNSRRYAKRQMTWFKKMPVKRWIAVEDPLEAATLAASEWWSGNARGAVSWPVHKPPYDST